ncbi:hypothetical protein FO488_00020 [Geobacter sp. FeAm09]|uniref:hypothetical protein n=1 Tax=Geobacter sp. FeAm09 TaxID=2597769 RepID=UPI0011EC40B3|nr:hypothetical protein [Geobacter sp. FeAm09]QEM66695.1 hypothetical protein FO488_00020 [Geobacter sp. FeAm09]
MSSRSRQTMLFAPLVVCSGLMLLTLPALASDGAAPDVGVENHEAQAESETEAYRFATSRRDTSSSPPMAQARRRPPTRV